jgi:hypothetical protein
MKLTNNPAWNKRLRSLRGYVASAAATLDHDDLEGDDPWENLEGDLNCALECVRQVLASKMGGRRGPPRRSNVEEELRAALIECEAVLSQLQDHMPLQGEAQNIMAQGYTGCAIVKARAALAKRAARPRGYSSTEEETA